MSIQVFQFLSQIRKNFYWRDSNFCAFFISWLYSRKECLCPVLIYFLLNEKNCLAIFQPFTVFLLFSACWTEVMPWIFIFSEFLKTSLIFFFLTFVNKLCPTFKFLHFPSSIKRRNLFYLLIGFYPQILSFPKKLI